jgi:ribonuclease P/MRP protein subunit POP7
MSIVKRVRKYLAAIDKRSMGDIGASFLAATSDNERMSIAGRGLSSGFAGINGSNGPRRSSNSAGDAGSNDGKRGEEVLVKGTGRAIAKVLDVATYFMAQPDCRVVVRTGSVGTVDDIEILQSSSIENVEGDLAEDREEIMADADAAEATSKAQDSKMDGNDSDTEIPESRVRWTSVLELSIFLH